MIRAGTRATTSPVFAAALTARCPRCNARAGVECRTRESGRPVWPPHETRVRRFRPRLGSPVLMPRPFAVRGRFLFGEWQPSPLGRDERSRELPGRSGDPAGNAAVAHPAGASARQVPGGVPRLFALVTAIVLLFFGCIR
jgi:hypothetical protein